MDFNHFLSSYLPDPAYGGTRLYRDMVEQAVWAEKVGYRAVSIPEHHLINILLVPSPLQLAVRIATLTNHIKLVTSIAVLPVRDMRIFAGEVVQASMLCDGRLVLGVGRGAFAYEVARLGTPIEQTRAKFDESLEVLQALLTREEVSWNGDFYRFDPITIMPRPEVEIPLMMAVMAPEGIEACARQGYMVQTTPLQASHSVLMEQVNAFKRGKAEAELSGRTSRLSLMRGIYLARDAGDARRKLELAYSYYERFDNVFSGPGIVDNGCIRPLPRRQSLEELGRSLIICEAAEMIDRISAYAEAGIDEVIMSSNFGQPQAETLDMMERFSVEVMPQLAGNRKRSAA
ncbi:LLM class flavin-dependent oxidoreductase [Mesorhizobium sp. PAMC28654]|uniref:LLM class flavin-dependent oxidoreductase n=1 Tax=Mesorhizobium sp. PAMC28654 TaxID=2880934 RepID=UPI001D0A0BA0|nr:LLM class flavin-dependent oxidoreductase [Mesorhizobium sp. PAMC28654]UDL89937.1 LLM class flavin-dependent oxidoreductase [Mesorhizobium sp. PAMC28654]